MPRSMKSRFRASGSALRVIHHLRAPHLMGRVHILCYHRIGADDESDSLTMPRWLFEQQMALLHRDYRPLSLGAAVACLAQQCPLPPRAVVVTFDDGYEDTFTRALPVLQRWEIPATVFVTTGYVDGLSSLAWRLKVPMLSWSMVRELAQAGLDIGSHTLTHPELAQLSFREAEEELVSSKHRLEDVVQQRVDLLAYPYGHVRSFDEETQRLVMEAGYRAAVTTVPGSNGSGTNRLALHRLTPSRRDVAALAMQLAELPLDRGLAAALTYGVRRKWAPVHVAAAA